MNNTIKYLFSELNFNRICIVLFLIIYIGFYYPEYQKYITLSYGVLFLGFVYNVLKCKGIKYPSFVLNVILFFLFSFISAAWAPLISSSNTAIYLLLKCVLVTICFINLIKNKKDADFALLFLFLGALIYALIYMSFVDISMLGDNRISTMDENNNLPNVNTVGLILSFAFSYFMFMYFKQRNILYLLGGLVGFIFIFLLGARKTILSLLICLFMLFLKLPKRAKIGIAIIAVAFSLCAFVVIPTEYLEFVFGRFGDTQSQAALRDSGDVMRLDFIVNGLDYFAQSPIWGHGYYSFSFLYGQKTGQYMYSHNNYIETLVGGGIIAFFLYYRIYYRIGKNLLSKKIGYDYGYLMLILGVILLFNHLTIVLLQEQFIWLLLSLMWTESYFFKQKK